MMAKAKEIYVDIDILEHVEVKHSPFELIIYSFKDNEKILIENCEHQTAFVGSHDRINEYISYCSPQIDWTPFIGGSYIKFEGESFIQSFFPLYKEENRFANLVFECDRHMYPKFNTRSLTDNELTRFKEKYENIKLNLQTTEVGTVINDDSPLAYKNLCKNIRPFETDVFKLEFMPPRRDYIVDEEINLLPAIVVTCRLPLFKIYVSLSVNADSHRALHQIFMKIDDEFYRFPYGNVSGNDELCLGRYQIDWFDVPIQNSIYYYLIITAFNGDYSPYLRHTNRVPTTFDLDWIKSKVSDDDFSISFLDALFYLSNCKTPEEVNKKIFFLSPNVPKRIIDLEWRSTQT